MQNCEECQQGMCVCGSYQNFIKENKFTTFNADTCCVDTLVLDLRGNSKHNSRNRGLSILSRRVALSKSTQITNRPREVEIH